ncbi:hypothetical protein N7468_007842 [Penicillium chermesinum]|uniref:Uncharacterized protein n=1 Tax=Penicillium chermesinum TaxID=63820 RepID=A0A9W9NNM7_9EURO|nr:uncharacterized protein N7468_007842 [Penicillium chermesinum]KAJ5223300.1 hypothetical protein N7468_007842 [Penicillium chermesinum]
MNSIFSLFRLQPREGSPGRSRIFIYLALAVIALLLSYQLVLNHGSLESVSPWGKTSVGGAKQDVAEPPTYSWRISRTPEKELVVAAMRDSDMAWVAENVPDWTTTIYRADADKSEYNFTVPRNKGNEAMVYLTYLIDRYDSLPEVMVLMHGGRYQWHNDNPLYDSVVTLKDLQIDHVKRTGYVNLRCVWAIGCPSELEPGRYFRERPDDPAHPTAVEYPDRFLELFPDEELPEVVGVPCCSQFAVSREAVRARPKADYERCRQWLLDVDLDNATSGRIFEYAWHIMFGKTAELCLDVVTCYCETYGYCDMEPIELQNHWVWRGMVLPPNWPESEEQS